MKTVCVTPPCANVFLGVTVWDVYTNGNVQRGLTMWDVLMTGNNFTCIIVFFSSTVRISVFECSPIAHDLILPSVCARRAYPRRFLGRVGRTPLSPTLTWRQFQMPSRKGVKTVCIAPTRINDVNKNYIIEHYAQIPIQRYNFC